jgi:hypothetical protein
MLKIKIGVVFGAVIAGVLMSAKLNAGPSDPVMPAREGGPNLVSNPGFEEGSKGWNSVVQKGKYDVEIDRTHAHAGVASAKIGCREPGLCMWRQVIPVEKGKKYCFSAWVKAEGNKCPGTIMVWLQQGDSPVKGDVLYFDEGQEEEVRGHWKKYVIPEVTTLEDHLTIILQSHDLYGDDYGAIWFDDIVLRKIGD